MKIVAVIVGALLGLLFIASGVMILFNLVKTPEMPKDTAIDYFMKAFGPTGYMKFIKVLEVLGGLFVAFPMTRNLGLLILGPIVVNILAFHVFVVGKIPVTDPMVLFVTIASAFLLFVERQAFAKLLTR